MERSSRDIAGIRTFEFTSWDDMLNHIGNHPSVYVAINAEKIISAPDKLRKLINENTGYCDGSGAVKVLHRKGLDRAVRLPGCELWLNIIRKYHDKWSFYIIGANPVVHDDTIEKLRSEFPGIKIAGHRNGFIKTDDERHRLIDDVAETKPDAVFVAMGTPKQEYLMAEMKQRHKDAVYVGLGGSYDVYTGAVKRAPKIWQNLGIEFMYRFIKNPSRWRRQFNYVIFVYRYMLNRL